MNRKGLFIISLTLLMALDGCTSRAMGQSYSAEVWPLFLPQPVNGGIRRIRAYKPSTVVMGRRELLRTTLYDRQGHMIYDRSQSEMPDSIERTYDSQGRLVEWRRVERRWDDDSQRMVWNNLLVEHIDYTPDGVVGLCRCVNYDRAYNITDTTVITYRLIHLVRGTGHGVTECDYAYCERGAMEVLTDTCHFRREYDDKGRLVREEYTDDVGSRGLDNYEVRHAYDPQGRKAYTLRTFYGGSDSLAYRYNALGGVVEKSGKSWVQGYESDIFISCRPDGSPLERTEITYPEEWDYGENPEQRTISRFWYNAMGDLIREEGPEGTREYDVEYWEE